MLAPGGQFIVSTPNKLYYTESRGAQGANPFHVHEFDFDEFRDELTAVFPHVSMFLENHVEGVTFQPHERGQHGGSAGGCRRSRRRTRVALLRGGVRAPAADRAIRPSSTCRARPTCCASASITSRCWRANSRPRTSGWRRRSRIWRSSTASTRSCSAMFRAQKAELERSNRWAGELNAELEARGARGRGIAGGTGARPGERARRWPRSTRRRSRSWKRRCARRRSGRIDTETRLSAEIREDSAELAQARGGARSRPRQRIGGTHGVGAARCDAERAQLEEQLTLVRASRWVKLGRKVGLGPDCAADMALLKRAAARAAAAAALALSDGDRVGGARRSPIWLTLCGESGRRREARVPRFGTTRRPSSFPIGTAAICWRSICPRS